MLYVNMFVITLTWDEILVHAFFTVVRVAPIAYSVLCHNLGIYKLRVQSEGGACQLTAENSVNTRSGGDTRWVSRKKTLNEQITHKQSAAQYIVSSTIYRISLQWCKFVLVYTQTV